MRPTGRLLVANLLVIGMGVGVARGDGKNIFDDDWTPPASAQKPATVATKPATPTPPAFPPIGGQQRGNPPPVAPQNPPAVEPNPSSATAAPGRAAIPASSEQAPVRTLMKEAFASQLADRSAPARRKLAGALFVQAEKSAPVPVEHYVVLAAAYEASVDGGDLAGACRAADSLSREFKVDALAMKTAAMHQYSTRPAAPGLTRELASSNVRAALDVASQLAATEDWSGAIHTCQAVGATSAQADAASRTLFQTRLRDYTQRRDVAAKIAAEYEKLAANPADPAANLAVGKYLCLIRGDWAAGLPMLGKGTDPALKAIAAKELAAPKSGEALADLAEEWWAFGGRQIEIWVKSGAESRAAELYGRANAAGLTGLRKILADRRIAEVQSTAAASAGAGLATRKTHTIAANQGWQPTIEVKAGDVITFVATGEVRVIPNKPMCGPDGLKDEHRPWGCLMAEIGTPQSRELFTVGSQHRHVAGMDGMLSFRVDDVNTPAALGDNVGQFQVIITRTPATRPLPLATGEPEEFIVRGTDIIARTIKAGEYEVTTKGEWSHKWDGPLHEPGWNGDEDNFVAKYPDDKFTTIGTGTRLKIGKDMIVRFKIRDGDGDLTDNRGQLTVSIRPAK